MKIDEAIKRLETINLSMRSYRPKERQQAVKLGIEALKRIKEYHHIDNTYQLLPGETKE